LPKDGLGTEANESKGISVSQQSYTQLVEHLDTLIHLLPSDGHYNPNATALKIVTLTDYSTTLKDNNQAVTDSATPLSNARISRDNTLYAGDTRGLDGAL
jgi:hypothetical protein